MKLVHTPPSIRDPHAPSVLLGNRDIGPTVSVHVRDDDSDDIREQDARNATDRSIDEPSRPIVHEEQRRALPPKRDDVEVAIRVHVEQRNRRGIRSGVRRQIRAGR